MTYIVSGGALNSTHSLHVGGLEAETCVQVYEHKISRPNIYTCPIYPPIPAKSSQPYYLLPRSHNFTPSARTSTSDKWT